MPTESGFATQKMIGRSRHKTLQPLGSNRVGAPSALMGLKAVSGTLTISSVELSADTKYMTVVFSSPHLASQEDTFRLASGDMTDHEFEVKSIVGASVLQLWNTGKLNGVDTLPEAGNTGKSYRWVVLEIGTGGSIPTSTPETPISENPSFANIDFSAANVAANGTSYTVVAVNVGAYAIQKIQIFMSAGDPLVLAFGAAAAEEDKIIIIPGGNGAIQLGIPAGTRLSVRRLAAGTLVDTGLLLINFLG